MSHGLLRRLALSAGGAGVTLVGLVVLNFFLLQLIPGDAADVLAAESGNASEESVAALRARFGLDLPLTQQLLAYLGNLAQLDLGYSPRYGIAVLDLILDRLPATLLLMGCALVFSLLSGVLLGVVMAWWEGRWPDRLLSFWVLLVYSTPSFWIGLLLIILFSVHLDWLPGDGSQTPGAVLHGWAWLWDRLRHVLLPALALSSFFAAIYARLTRTSMLEVLGQDFIRTARAKGVHPWRLALRHALRNALLPVTSVAGNHVGNLLGGAAVIETVFSWPGLGRLALDAIQGRDYNVLLGVLLLSSCVVVLVNALIDVLQMWIDPRTRLS